MTDVVTSADRSDGPLAFSRLADLGSLLKRSDLGLAVGVMAILVILILPLPSLLLDFALAISITFSVLILMTSLFIQAPLEFSAFPTVLLIATMLRLALNLASTRLILARGHEGTDAAGHVIQAFGNFVMAGNFIIGIIVFTILVIVNFVVITKGSGRIAEVAARFHLDSMPGKQMAIDADLSAGLIDEKEARRRRKNLEDESGFFGAMDGASKFVRGDAIAGLLVLLINVIGGMVIGIMQQGLSFAEAGHAYTLLSVGDGLVTQVPALIVSIAAGPLVSKAGVAGAADKALLSQFSTSRSSSATRCCRWSTRVAAATASPSRSRRCAVRSPPKWASSCRRCASSTTSSSTPTATSSRSRRWTPATARSWPARRRSLERRLIAFNMATRHPG